MKKTILAIVILVLIAPLSLSAASLSQLVDAGYMWDLGGTFRFRIGEMSEDLPFFLDFGIGFVYQFDSGDATAARSIFINDNTGGVIEKHGESIVASIDIGYPFPLNKKGLKFEPYVGARFDYYKAYYAFIGNNEAFTVNTSQWGVALGARLSVPISRKGDYFFINGGGEFYFKAPLLSHGTYFYNPDGVDDRPRTTGGGVTYSYQDADEAVRQPRFRPVITLGIRYSIR